MRATLLSLTVALALAACATTKPDTQWTDPAFAGKSLVGQTVLVTCTAPDSVQIRVCLDRISAQVTSLGATAVEDSAAADLALGAVRPASDLIAAANRASARAIFAVQLSPDAAVVKPGPSFGIGLGGFGGNVGGGLGLSKSVGPDSVLTGLAAVGTLTDVGSGRAMWSARVHTDPSDKLDEQISKVSEQVVQASRNAGVL